MAIYFRVCKLEKYGTPADNMLRLTGAFFVDGKMGAGFTGVIPNSKNSGRIHASAADQLSSFYVTKITCLDKAIAKLRGEK